MREYRLVTFESDGQPSAGITVGERVYSLNAVLGDDADVDTGSILSLLAHWEKAQEALAAAVDGLDEERGRDIADTRLLAPILYPPVIYCAGANYTDHVEEVAEAIKKISGAAPPSTKSSAPFFFAKPGAHCTVGNGDDIAIPAFTEMLDWEAEIGVVIGRTAKNVGEADALDYVAGYTIVNDMSARDFVTRDDIPFKYDWFAQKCFDGAAPTGPGITPTAFVGDPHKLAIKLWVNDELKQDSNSDKMIFSIEEQISWLSKRLTLRPGDIISTGTPAGVAFPLGGYLKPGDRVTIEIEKLGRLVNQYIN